MRRTISSIALPGFALLAACGHGRAATSAPTLTSAPVSTSGAPIATGGGGECELPRTFRSTSERLGVEVCRHEQRCNPGRGEDAQACVSATAARAQAELARWNCEPAAIRARYEECLAGLDERSCDLDLRASSRPLCPPVLGCGDAEAKLIDPGPALEAIWR